MNSRPGDTAAKTAAPGKTSGHKDRWGGGSPRQSKLPLSAGIARTMQDNAEIYASTTRSHPSDAPALIPNTISPPNT